LRLQILKCVANAVQLNLDELDPDTGDDDVLLLSRIETDSVRSRPLSNPKIDRLLDINADTGTSPEGLVSVHGRF
jgi:hypothetical protein